MNVILVGAGRYGNSLIGRKYRDKEFKADLTGVVDPKIDEIKKQDTYKLGNTPTYKNLKEVPKNELKNSIVEIALIPQIIPQTFADIANKGVKNVILPKPVTSDRDKFEGMLETTKKNKMNVVVASNWHYSEITGLTKAVIEKVRGKEVKNKAIEKKYDDVLQKSDKQFEIEKVEVEYNKKNEVLTIDPPSQELPHALQMVYSTGITDFKDTEMKADKDKQSKSRVNIELSNVKGIKDGITINSDLQMGDKLDKRRERLLKIYLNDDDKEPDIIADYDALFSSEGECLKRPTIEYDVTKDGERTHWKVPIEEDNLNIMYEEMFNFFEGKENNALTLEEYTPVAEEICEAQEKWELARKQQQ